MSEQSEFSADPLHATRVILDQLEIFELTRESVVLERFRLGKALAVAPNAAAGKIEGDRGQAVLRQCLRQMRKERPPRKALEAVTHDHGTQRIPGAVQIAPQRQPVLTWNLERLGCNYASRRGCHPSISPFISAHP